MPPGASHRRFATKLVERAGLVRPLQAGLILSVVFLLAESSGLFAASDDLVTYEVTFEATWSEDRHPADFPQSAHFSPIAGATHDASVTFWALGEKASAGIRVMAETGAKKPLEDEFEAGKETGAVFSIISGDGIPTAPGATSKMFEVTKSHPLVTVVSMIAPSPDWFTGLSGFSLRDAGRWIEERSITAPPYDAGTDSGLTYSSADEPTQPPEPITRKDDAPFVKLHTPSVATITFRLVTELEGEGEAGSAPGESSSVGCSGAPRGAPIGKLPWANVFITCVLMIVCAVAKPRRNGSETEPPTVRWREEIATSPPSS